MSAVSKPVHSFARVAGAGLLMLFVFLVWYSARSGLASLLYRYALTSNRMEAANAAVNLSSSDPEAHSLRGALLEASGDLAAAIAEYNQAILRRPDDYVLWLGLARARELNGEPLIAIAAARQATKLAPYYAQPHWQLGNFLVRAGQVDEGFKELRLAGASNPALLPGIIDLAWQISNGDTQFVKRSIEPRTPASYRAVAAYFRKRGEFVDAVALLNAAGNDAEVVRDREQYLTQLIDAKKFKEAYQLWSNGRGLSDSNSLGALIDSGFEQESNLSEAGFGWRSTNRASSISFSLDVSNPHEGRSSLNVEFKGDSDPGAPIISQLVQVEPNTRYQLHFAARTESIVSGGLPRVAVVDAANTEMLGSSVRLPQQTSNWQDYTIDFVSKGSTSAILISCQRDSCSKAPCPIFGRLWLDSFTLRKI